MPFGLISNIINAAANMTTAVDNKEIAAANREQEAYWNMVNMQEAQRIINQNRKWEIEDRDYLAQREDTSIQRKAEDLKKAGINPLLAGTTGGSASSLPAVRNTSIMAPAQFTPTPYQTAPNINLTNNGDPIERMLEKERKIAEIEKIRAETKATGTNTKGTELDNIRKETENEFIREKIQKELKNIDIQNANLEQTGKNLMAEFGYRLSEEQRAKAMHEIEKVNKQTERALNQARTWNEQSETALTDQEKAIRKEEFRIKKEQIEKGYLLEMMRIFGDTAGKIKFKGK